MISHFDLILSRVRSARRRFFFASTRLSISYNISVSISILEYSPYIMQIFALYNFWSDSRVYPLGRGNAMMRFPEVELVSFSFLYESIFRFFESANRKHRTDNPNSKHYDADRRNIFISIIIRL